MEAIGYDRVSAYRLERTRLMLAEAGVDAAILFDPLNLRYATGSRNMQVWSSHHMVRYVFVPVSGPVVLFDYGGAMHLSDSNTLISETRPAKSWDYFGSGSRAAEHATLWASEIADLLREVCGQDATLGLDRADLLPLRALDRLGVHVVDAKGPLELARSVKSTEEIEIIRGSMQVCTDAITFMRQHARPGVSENYLLSLLNQYNIEHGGEHQETRCLASGHHTNPWFTEASAKIIEAGEMLVFDSDLVGPNGIFTDQTRSFVIGDCRPAPEQRTNYALAYEQLQHNLSLLRPGLTFEEYIQASWQMPDLYVPNRYAEMVHGIGFGVEYPLVYFRQDAPAWQYPGEFVEGMTVCVESYIGAVGGPDGVKLEQPALITSTGPVALSDCPFELDYL
ncbi:M24 family metallopeptidase [Paraburkholderia aspalathi]|jgi:Xaa-Pro dipeptidase|uniref:M24 family metallopeptidase n=1 Tax=Paraburkholderia aspalathi TaxID=1324617 RepID=UPI0038B7B377